MNRREYMNALEEALRFLPEETRQAALDFYGEMMDDRMEDGMDESIWRPAPWNAPNCWHCWKKGS